MSSHQHQFDANQTQSTTTQKATKQTENMQTSMEVEIITPNNNDEASRNSASNRKPSLPITPEEENSDLALQVPTSRPTQVLAPQKGPPKVLIVFPNFDAVADNLVRAADKLSFEVTTSESYEKSLDEYSAKTHDLVLVDARSAKALDYETLCRSIRNSKGSQHTVIIAVIKKSAFDRDDTIVSSLLEAGFTRCISETINMMAWVNELIQIKHSDIRPMAQQAATQTLFAALDKCKDIVLITDDACRVQYINAAGEHLLGYKGEEVAGKNLQESLVTDPLQVNLMSSHLRRGRDWQGSVTVKRKNCDPLVVPCKAVSRSCAGRNPTHFIIVADLLSSGDHPVIDKARGSIPSIGRQSVDVRSIGSEYLRRSSVARLSNLPLEAPITKIITLIANAQELCGNPQVITILDRVVESLKSTELYTPNIRDDLKLVRSEEPVASDLIGALLTQQAPVVGMSASRRSSNDSQAIRATKASKIKLPTQVKEMLEHAMEWSFDIIRLEEITNKRPLMYLGMHLFLLYDVPNILECDEKTLYNWLTVMEANYHTDNWYHNSTHASDVMQAVAGFLQKDRVKNAMEPLDHAISLISAAAHDLDHPGKSSAFLSNSKNPLAILYNDLTVLESHHVALMFKLTLADDRINIFKNMDVDSYKIARTSIIDMILATEMTKHFEHLAKFVTVFCQKSEDGEEVEIPIINNENLILIKRIMIKCADVSNPTRSLSLCVEWARRIAEEYFQQTDEEKARGLPVVMPLFDRQTCSIPKAQIGFVDYIVNDMFEAWNAFIDMPELLVNMHQNYIKWKQFDDEGYSTLADIRKLQYTVLAGTRNMKYDKVDE